MGQLLLYIALRLMTTKSPILLRVCFCIARLGQTTHYFELQETNPGCNMWHSSLIVLVVGEAPVEFLPRFCPSNRRLCHPKVSAKKGRTK